MGISSDDYHNREISTIPLVCFSSVYFIAS